MATERSRSRRLCEWSGGRRVACETDRGGGRERCPGGGADAGGPCRCEDRLDGGGADGDRFVSILDGDVWVRLHKAENRGERVDVGKFLNVGFVVDTDVGRRLDAKR